MERSFVWCQIVVTNPLYALPPPSSMLTLQDANSYRSKTPCGQTLGIFTIEHSRAKRYQIWSFTRVLKDDNMTHEKPGSPRGDCRYTRAETASISVTVSLVTAIMVMVIVFIMYCKSKGIRQCRGQSTMIPL